MKKTLLILVAAALSLGVSSSVFAASSTITLSPSVKSVAPGQTVFVTVQIVPAGNSVTTAKARLTYPADILEVQTFAFSDEWLPLTQTGYSVTDNVGGILIRTAGFPGGLSATKTLGTITFRVKAAGTATVAVANDSLLLDSKNVNLFVSGSSSVLTSAQPAATPVASRIVAVASVAPAASPAESATPEASVSATPGDQTAAIGAGLSTGRIALYIALGLGVLALLWFIVRRRRSDDIPMA